MEKVTSVKDADMIEVSESFAGGEILPKPTTATSLALQSSGKQDEKTEEKGNISNYFPILALCWFVALLSALDRVAMSVAILPLSQELHLTETIKGQISSVVSIGYGLAIVPVGLLVAVAPPRWIMAGGVGLWSVATIGTPLAAGLVVATELASVSEAPVVAYAVSNLAPLLGVRAVMGAAEAVVLPTIQRILANWVPPENKSFALASIISGFQAGTVCAYLISPMIMDELGGWRGLFYLYGMLGVAWLIPWFIFARGVPSSGALEDEECEVPTLVNSMKEDDASLVIMECPGTITTESKETSLAPTALAEATAVLKSAPWSAFMRCPGVWGMTLAHAAKNWGLYNLMAWLPTFYNQQYGLNVKESAIFAILPSVCGAVGGLAAGKFADEAINRLGDNNRTAVRKAFQSVALLGPASCLFALSSDIPDQATTAQALLTGAVGLQAFDAAGFGAATQEKAGERWAGLLYSITSLPGVMIGSLSVYATGQILDATSQDWSIVFGLNAAINILGAAAFIGLYDSEREFD